MLKTLVVPSGRTGRLRFWNTLAALGIAYEVSGLAIVIVGSGVFAWNMRTSTIALACHAYVFLSLGVILGIRRLHDRDMSGWWILLSLVPVAGTLWYLWNGCRRGGATSNRFGPSTTHDGALVAVFDADAPAIEARGVRASAFVGSIVLWLALAATTTITLLLFQNPSR